MDATEKSVKKSTELKEKSSDATKKAKKTSKKTNQVTISKKEYETLLIAKELSEKYLYLYSDFENYKKRILREQVQTNGILTEKVIAGFLPIIDNIDIALEHLEENENKDALKDFIDGLNLIKDQFNKSLASFDVKAIECVGQHFDPNFHEAMDQAQDKDEKPGIVLKEYQKGYLIKDKLLRAARVRVNANR